MRVQYMYGMRSLGDEGIPVHRERMMLLPRAADAGWCSVGPRECTFGATRGETRQRMRERKGGTRDRRIPSANSVGEFRRLVLIGRVERLIHRHANSAQYGLEVAHTPGDEKFEVSEAMDGSVTEV